MDFSLRTAPLITAETSTEPVVQRPRRSGRIKHISTVQKRLREEPEPAATYVDGPSTSKRVCEVLSRSAIQEPCRAESSSPGSTHLTKTRKPDKQNLCTINHGVVVKPSTIPEGGNGLYADRDFAKGEWVTFYDGDVREVGKQEKQSLSTGSHSDWCHVVSVDQFTVIHTPTEPSTGDGGGGFINDGVNIFSPSNVRSVRDSERKMVLVKATRDIKKGEELFISYGNHFWNRFKDCLPDEHEKIIAPQIRTRSKGKALLDSRDDRGRFKTVIEGLKDTPVPVMPEWHNETESWSTDLARYAMYKVGVADGGVLNLDALRNLDAESDEYFKAVGQYSVSLTQTPRKISGTWNSRSDTYQGLKIPQNGVFKPADKWSSSHIHIFFRQFRDGYHIDITNLKMCMNVLEPGSKLYEELFEEYIQTETGLKPGDTLDLRTDAGRRIRKRLYKCLARASSPVQLPVNYKGKPFADLQRKEKPGGDKHAGWSYDAIYNFLEAMGVNVIRFDRSKVSDLHVLDVNTGQETTESEAEYFQTLKSWSVKVGFDFKQGRLMRARHKRQRIQNEGEQGSPSPAFRRVNGLTLHDAQYHAAGLFLQYIEHFGMDDPRLAVNFSSENLYRALELFEQPVSSQLQALYEQLFSLAWRDLANKNAAFTAMRRHSGLKLPASVSGMSREEAFATLKNKGKKLERDISSLTPQTIVN